MDKQILSQETLQTKRLLLVPLCLEFCKAIVLGKRKQAENILGYKLGNWPSGRELEYAFPIYLTRLEQNPLLLPWQGRAMVLPDKKQVIGSANLKGYPKNGQVEIGYGTEINFRKQGYAKEAAYALLTRAFQHIAVREVIAVVEPRNYGSIRVLESIGMKNTQKLSLNHPGAFIWKMARDTFFSSNRNEIDASFTK